MQDQPTVAIASAFSGAVDGVEKSTATLPGRTGLESHPFFPLIKSSYRFGKDAFMTISYAWHREWLRKECDPRRGIWLGGPKGCGKTTMCEQFFARLGVPVVSLTCNRRIPLSDYIRQMVPDGEGGWICQKGPLVVAMEMGFPVVLNEPTSMDPADITAMHDIIDRGLLVQEDGVVVRAARGFTVFATDNSMGIGDMTGSYPGLNTMSAASMSRFFKFEVGYPDEKEELEILKSEYPQQKAGILKQFIKMTNMVRAAYLGNQSQVTMGTRELIDWVGVSVYFAGMTDQGREPAWFGLQRVAADGLPSNEAKALRKHYEAVFIGKAAGAEAEVA